MAWMHDDEYQTRVLLNVCLIRVVTPTTHPACLCTHSQDGWTPLIMAAGKGHVEVVKVLQEMGADVNIAAKVRGGGDGWRCWQL